MPHREKGELLPSEVAVNWELRHWVLELYRTVGLVVTVLGWAVVKESNVNWKRIHKIKHIWQTRAKPGAALQTPLRFIH